MANPLNQLVRRQKMFPYWARMYFYEDSVTEARRIAIDFGGSKLRFAHVGDDIRDEQTLPSNALLPREELREYFLGSLTDYVAATGLAHRIEGIGIAIAGQVDSHRGVLRSSPNVPDWREAPLRQWVQSKFSVPVAVENDVRAAAWGEYARLSHAGVRDLVCLFWGTGIGGGMITGGQLLRGYGNAAGEIGHTIFEPKGRMCNCGKRGCFEAYAGGWAMAEQANEMARRDGNSPFASHLGTPGVFKLAAEGYAPALAIREIAVRAISLLAANLTVIFNPQVLVVGGGLSVHYPAIVDLVEASIVENSLPIDQVGLRIEASQGGDTAALWGAARLLSMTI